MKSLAKAGKLGREFKLLPYQCWESVHTMQEKKKLGVGSREVEMPSIREGRKGAQGLMGEGENVYVEQRDKNNDVEIN